MVASSTSPMVWMVSWQRYWYTNRIGERPVRWKSEQFIDLGFRYNKHGSVHLIEKWYYNIQIIRKWNQYTIKLLSISLWFSSLFLLIHSKNKSSDILFPNQVKEETRNKKRAQTKSHNKMHARSIRRPLLLACTIFLRPFLSSYCYYIYSYNISELCFSHIAFIF